MKKVENFFLLGCTYTVLILSFFYAFAKIVGFADTSIPAEKFLLIISFGFLISGVNLLCKSFEMNKFLRFIIHYSVLLVGFLTVFIFSTEAAGFDAGKIFTAVVIFSLLYFAVLGLSIPVKKLFAKISSKEKPQKKPREEKPTYTSRFGG